MTQGEYLTIRISSATRALLDAEAEAQDRSVSWVVRDAVERSLGSARVGRKASSRQPAPTRAKP